VLCEGVLFDDTYAVTVDTLPDHLTLKQLHSITLDTLPPSRTNTRPLFPSASSFPPLAANLSKAKARHPEGYPKGPRSGYVYYTAAMRARVQSAESEEERRAVTFDWPALSERERTPYMRLAEMDKVRWKGEMTEWKRRTEEGGGNEDSSADADDVHAEDSL